MIRRLFRAVADRIADRVALRVAAASTPAAPDERLLLLAGRLHAERVRGLGRIDTLAQAEFRVFSQWGEDGIIQYLVAASGLRDGAFVEFGVQNYLESNTRFLLLNDNWRGLVMDSSAQYIDYIRADPISWRHDLGAVHALVSPDNVNALIAARFPDGKVDLLSIDIDGNDYWVWEAVRDIKPAIVICEYNSLFGPDLAVTIPYRADFDRTAAHWSNLYWGTSLAALCRLAERKGYRLAGSNSAGNNAFFVRRDLAPQLPSPTPAAGYVEARYRDSRDAQGRLTFLAGEARLALIADLPLHEVDSGRERPIRELYAQRLGRAG